MAYIKQTFVAGQVLTAEHMNHIEDGLENLDAASEAKVDKSGSRGTLAGYSVPSVTSSAISITGESADEIQVTGAVEISVENGVEGTSWPKIVSITDASATITLGSNWTWAGGEVPTVEANCILVLYWCNTFGKANLIVGGE
jgi:hypothetical protein